VRRLVLLVTIAAVAAGFGTVGRLSAARERAVRVDSATSCRAGFLPAVINAKRTCLRAGQRCARRFDRQYHHYGFHCHTGRLRADPWIALESRRLRLPRITPGAICPRSSGRQVTPAFGILFGDGPAYAGIFQLDNDGVVRYGGSTKEGGWYYAKVLWVTDGSDRERTLVRGRQLDGPNHLSFGFGADPAKELRIPVLGSVNGSNWGHHPSETRIRAPGCYAYQADGKDFSTVIVFQAAP
jgi:hypothetical protein